VPCAAVRAHDVTSAPPTLSCGLIDRRNIELSPTGRRSVPENDVQREDTRET
jgi:hypothetical protein